MVYFSKFITFKDDSDKKCKQSHERKIKKNSGCDACVSHSPFRRIRRTSARAMCVVFSRQARSSGESTTKYPPIKTHNATSTASSSIPELKPPRTRGKIMKTVSSANSETNNKKNSVVTSKKCVQYVSCSSQWIKW